MSNARWIEVAQAVADEINDNDWSLEFEADRNYADWGITLEVLGTLRCDVVPVNKPTTELDANGVIGYRVLVDIALRYRFKPDELDADGRVGKPKADALSFLLQEIAEHFTKLSLDSVNAIWYSTEYLQTHSPQALFENKQFTGIV